jgi:hypothetical protein
MEDVLIGLHSERCDSSLPSHVLKASSKAMAIEKDEDPLCMVLMKLHDAAGGPIYVGSVAGSWPPVLRV